MISTAQLIDTMIAHELGSPYGLPEFTTAVHCVYNTLGDSWEYCQPLPFSKAIDRAQELINLALAAAGHQPSAHLKHLVIMMTLRAATRLGMPDAKSQLLTMRP